MLPSVFGKCAIRVRAKFCGLLPPVLNFTPPVGSTPGLRDISSATVVDLAETPKTMVSALEHQLLHVWWVPVELVGVVQDGPPGATPLFVSPRDGVTAELFTDSEPLLPSSFQYEPMKVGAVEPKPGKYAPTSA